MIADNFWQGEGEVLSKKDITITDPVKGSYFVTDITLSCIRIVREKVKKTTVPLEAWGVLSEIAKDIEVGDYIKAEGRFENKEWSDAEGHRKSKNVITLEALEKL